MSTPIHRRNYDCQAFDEGDGRMRVRGRLVDTRPQGLGRFDGEPMIIHNMVIDLYIDVATFTIVEVETGMDEHPYPVCTAVLPDYQRLVGLSIARGYSRKVKDMFGGPGGCSHIGALLQALGPVAVQARWSATGLDTELEDRLLDDPQDRADRLRLNVDTCHVWAEGGEHMQKLEFGDDPLRPNAEAERLVTLATERGLDWQP